MIRVRPSDAATPIVLFPELSRRTFTALTLLASCALYGLALNPYLLPDTYDNVMYLVGARSIAEHGAFTFGGFRIADWPPGLSTLLAIPIALGFDGVVAAKLVILGTVILSLWASIHLLAQESRPHARLVTLAVAMLATAFLLGIRVMSEWPFTACSLGLLLVLHRMGASPHRWRWAVLGGLLLGAATLTRFVGVTLGAAVVAQGLLAGRGLPLSGRVRAALPAVLVGALGGAMTIAWRLSVAADTSAGLSWVFYSARQTTFMPSDFFGLTAALGDLLFRASRIAAVLDLPRAFPALIGLVAGSVMVLGAVIRIRARGVQLSDCYVLATLVVLLGLEWKHGRYLLPIAPFLLSDLLLGGRAVLYRALPAHPRVCDRLAIVAGAVWVLLSATSNGLLLVRGNGHTHGSLIALLSPTPESFYLGDWRDLSVACAVVRSSGDPRSVLVVGRHDLIYPSVWCDRPTLRIDEGDTAPSREALCAAPPYPTESGYALKTDGRPTPPLRTFPGVQAPEGRCATGWVLTQEPARLPEVLPGMPPLRQVGTWGAFTLWHALGDAEPTRAP